jgi:archaemetzincin
MELKIHIIPLNPVEDKVLGFLKENLSQVFHAETEISEEVKIGVSFLNTKRNQYHAHEILKFLIRKMDSVAKEEVCLGIFKKDMYTPPLNFVFGLASLYPRVCLISLARLHPSFPNEKELGTKEERLFLGRILKEAVHEIGHTLELEHCDNSKCVMHFSNTLADTDFKGNEFCRKCARMIQK